MGFFTKDNPLPKMFARPPLPPPADPVYANRAPGLDTVEVQNAADAERRLRAGRGREGTVLTRPWGLTNQSTEAGASGRLLGAGY